MLNVGDKYIDFLDVSVNIIDEVIAKSDRFLYTVVRDGMFIDRNITERFILSTCVKVED